MKCIKCNAELPEGAVFCGVCGTKQEEQVETPSTETISDLTPEPKAEATSTPEPTSKPTPEPTSEPTSEPTPEPTSEPIPSKELLKEETTEVKKEKSMKIPLIAGGGILAIIAVYFLVTLIIGAFGGSNNASWYDSENLPLFYVDRGDLLVYYPGDKEGTEIVEDFEQTGYAFALDENSLYYTDNGDLYFKSRKKDSVSIDENVRDIIADREATIMFYLNDDNELFVYDGKDSKRILEDVYDIYDYEFVREQNQLVFVYSDDNYNEILAVYSDGEVTELSDEKTYSILHVDKETVIYAESDDYTNYDVVKSDYTGDDEKLFSYDNAVEFSSDGSKALFLDRDELSYFNGEDVVEIGDEVESFIIYEVDDFNAVIITEDDLAVWFEGEEEWIEVVDVDDVYTYDVTDDLKEFVVANDDYELVVYTKKFSKYKEEEYDLNDIENITIMSDNKTALIKDDDNTLYSYKIGAKEANEILDDVLFFSGYEKNNIIIKTIDDEVAYYDGKEAEEVGEDVMSNYSINLDVPSYSYTDNRGNFFYGKKGKEVEEKLDDVEAMVNYNNEFIYLLDDSDDVYLYEAGDKKVQDLDFEADSLISFWMLLY